MVQLVKKGITNSKDASNQLLTYPPYSKVNPDRIDPLVKIASIVVSKYSSNYSFTFFFDYLNLGKTLDSSSLIKSTLKVIPLEKTSLINVKRIIRIIHRYRNLTLPEKLTYAIIRVLNNFIVADSILPEVLHTLHSCQQ